MEPPSKRSKSEPPQTEIQPALPASPPPPQPPSPPPPAPQIPLIQAPPIASNSEYLPFIPFRTNDPRFASLPAVFLPPMPPNPISTSPPPSPSTGTLREYLRVSDQLADLDKEFGDREDEEEEEDDDDEEVAPYHPMAMNAPILNDVDVLRTQRRQLRERLDQLSQQIIATDIFTVTCFAEFEVIGKVKDMYYEKIFVHSSTSPHDCAYIEYYAKSYNTDDLALYSQKPRAMILKESTLSEDERANLPGNKADLFAQEFPDLPPPRTPSPSPPPHTPSPPQQ